MKLSISNIAWEKQDDEKVYANMQKLGFSGLEIAPTRLFDQPAYSKLNEATEFAKNLKSKYGLSISSMQSIWYGVAEQLFGTQEERQYLYDYTKEAINFANALSCPNIVFGCPKNRSKPENSTAEPSHTLEPIHTFFSELGDYATKHGTTIALEPNPPIYGTNFINTTQEALDMVKTINNKGFRINLDIGTILHNEEDTNMLNNNWHLINHVHISEPNLKLIKENSIHKDIINSATTNNYQGYFSIEMAKQPIEDVISTMKYTSTIYMPLWFSGKY